MNSDDRIDAFFGWPQYVDAELALGEQMPEDDLDTSTRRWWRQVMQVMSPVTIEVDDDLVETAIFRDHLGAQVQPTLGMVIVIDWWSYDGRQGARDLHQMCREALQALGRA